MTDHPEERLRHGYVLPFATTADNRFKGFTKNMEMAAVVYLAESDREKNEGHIIKKSDEKIIFIAETYYPIWLIPYAGAILIFDGVGIASHTLFHDRIADIEIFDRNLRENQKTTELYAAAIAGSTDYFKHFNGREEQNIEGLIAGSDIIKAFTSYFPQMKETKKSFATKVVLTPKIDMPEIQVGIEQISNLKKRISTDVENIDQSMKLLNKITSERTKAIREEIKKTREKHDKQIEKIRPRVSRKIRQIQNKYSRRFGRKSEIFKKRLQRLRQNQFKLQKTLRHSRAEAKQCEKGIRSSRRHKKKQARTRLTLKLERIKKKLPTLDKEIEATIKTIQNVEALQKLELAQQKTECEAHIDAANKTILELQAAKEAEITTKKQEITTLVDLTNYITSQMHEIAKTKRVIVEEFDQITIPRRRESCALAYIPFYLVRYEKEGKKRYVIYPPSTVSDMGILTKMKGALGAAKMKALLQPRSEVITTFLNQLVAVIEKDPMLEKVVTEDGIKNSVLLRKQLRLGVRKGLRELEKENWISKNELQALSKLLYTYAQLPFNTVSAQIPMIHEVFP